jgi:hypothetical protein
LGFLKPFSALDGRPQEIEELFIIMEQVWRANVAVIIAPHDPRQMPLQANSTHPAWTIDLYKDIIKAFSGYARQPSPA